MKIRFGFGDGFALFMGALGAFSDSYMLAATPSIFHAMSALGAGYMATSKIEQESFTEQIERSLDYVVEHAGPVATRATITAAESGTAYLLTSLVDYIV